MPMTRGKTLVRQMAEDTSRHVLLGRRGAWWARPTRARKRSKTTNSTDAAGRLPEGGPDFSLSTAKRQVSAAFALPRPNHQRSHPMFKGMRVEPEGACHECGKSGRAVRFRDLTGSATYDRDGGELVSRGLYLDLPPWGYHVFEVQPHHK